MSLNNFCNFASFTRRLSITNNGEIVCVLIARSLFNISAVLRESQKRLSCSTEPQLTFDAKFYVRKMKEQCSKNIFSANSLRQKLHRLHVSPTRDQVTSIFSDIHNPVGAEGCVPSQSTDLPYDPKLEQRVIDEFLASSAVYHEKIRRQISSVECEIASIRESLGRKAEEEIEQQVVILDLRTEVSELFDELQFKKDQCADLKIKHDVVMNDLVKVQDKFSCSSVDLHQGMSSLDGMRRNIIRLLSSNKELVNQQRFMAKQLQLFTLKLKATQTEISKTRGTQQIGLKSPDEHSGLFSQSHEPIHDDYETNFLREITVNGNSGSTACNLYHKLFPTNDIVSTSSADLAHRRSRIIHLLGREFFTNWKDAQTMFSLSEALQHMATLRDIDGAVQFVMSAICKLCECDRASYWVVDRQKGIAWTKVPSYGPSETRLATTKNIKQKSDELEEDDTTEDYHVPQQAKENMTTLMIPVNTGLVGAAFKTGSVLNIADAYGDSRFNRMVDLKTDYRTKSVLCYPIVYHGQVLGVCQCINKISPSASVFSASDIETVKTLGSAMLNVLGSCHAHEESKRLAERRNILVNSIGDIVRRMNNRKDLVLIVRETLRKIFKAHDATIVLVYRDFYAKISIDFDGSISLVESDRDDQSGGLIHACAQQKSPLNIFGRQALAGWKNNLAKVDLDILKTGCLDASSNPSQLQEGDVSVHCVPLVSPSRPDEISAVIQWVCLDRSVIGFGDDGSFDEKNAVHVDMVDRMMKVVGFHIERFWPSKYRLLWTKAKHLQLKIRGMISFSTAGRSPDGETGIHNPLRQKVPAPTNRRIIDLWIKAKNLVLENKLMTKVNKEQPPTSERKRITTQSSAEFIDQMTKERGSLMKRSTVTINPNALEDLLAACNITTSPFAKSKTPSRLDFMSISESHESAMDAIDESSSESESSSDAISIAHE